MLLFPGITRLIISAADAVLHIKRICTETSKYFLYKYIKLILPAVPQFCIS